MAFFTRITDLYSRFRKAAEQWYTPRELRAIVIFVATGLAIVIYRDAKKLYFTEYPAKQDAQYRAERHAEDSLFHALSAAADKRDSLFFSLPEDSLLPPSVLQRQEHHTKEEGLRPESISLNHASKEDLVRLPTVGPAMAERILEYRSQRGSFRSLAELRNIRGFGEKHFERVRKFLRLN